MELGKADAVKSSQGVCLEVGSHGPASSSANNQVTWEESLAFSLLTLPTQSLTQHTQSDNL